MMRFLTFLAFVLWAAIELSYGASWTTVLAAALWGGTGYNVGFARGMEWMRKTWKLPGGKS